MSYLETIYKAIEQANLRLLQKKTYMADGEHLLRCSLCQEHVQMQIQLLNPEPEVVPCMCSCDTRLAELRKKAELEQERQIRVASNRNEGITDSRYANYRWEVDDSPESTESRLCRAYANSWEQMRAEGAGLLLSGSVGSGKTFYAACIGNQLLDQGVRVGITTLTDAINRTFGSSDKMAEMRRFQSFDLLIIDDFGAERDTEFSKEQVFAIVDARSRADKPTIFTTNLTLQNLQNAKNIQDRRIYDRVLEMAPVPINFKRESRRQAVAESKRARAVNHIYGQIKEGKP